jgi:hypothetical protein
VGPARFFGRHVLVAPGGPAMRLIASLSLLVDTIACPPPRSGVGIFISRRARPPGCYQHDSSLLAVPQRPSPPHQLFGPRFLINVLSAPTTTNIAVSALRCATALFPSRARPAVAYGRLRQMGHGCQTRTWLGRRRFSFGLPRQSTLGVRIRRLNPTAVPWRSGTLL